MWLIINCVISCYRIRFKVTLFKYIFGPPLLLYSTAHTDCEGCVGMRLYRIKYDYSPKQGHSVFYCKILFIYIYRDRDGDGGVVGGGEGCLKQTVRIIYKCMVYLYTLFILYIYDKINIFATSLHQK